MFSCIHDFFIGGVVGGRGGVLSKMWKFEIFQMYRKEKKRVGETTTFRGEESNQSTAAASFWSRDDVLGHVVSVVGHVGYKMLHTLLSSLLAILCCSWRCCSETCKGGKVHTLGSQQSPDIATFVANR